MPEHLVRLGTKQHRYTHRVVLGDIGPAQYGDHDAWPTQLVDYELVPLETPIYETTVWGIKQ